MTMDILRNRSVWGWRSDAAAEGFESHAAGWEPAHRWHEESKRRYEHLAHQWLELAEQRQRCA